MKTQWDFLLAGASGAGKSSLIARLAGLESPVRKTQALIFHAGRFIDLPGEYLTHPYLRRQFLSALGQAGAALFLLAANALPSPLPSGFFGQLGATPCYGVISKIDLPEADPARAETELERLGLKRPFFQYSLYDESTLEQLKRLTRPRRSAARTEEAHEA